MYSYFRKTSAIVLPFVFVFAVAVSSCHKDVYIIQDNITEAKTTTKTILVAPSASNNANSQSLLQVLDEKGNIIKQKTIPNAVMNFQQWNINGKTRYTYLEYDPAAYHIPNVGYISGSVMLLDSNLDVLNQFRLLPFNERTSSSTNTLDGHEFILLSDDHYIAMAYYEKVVKNIPDSLHPSAGCKVVCPIIQEVDNGSVVWEWDGSDNPEFYANSIEGNNFSNTAQTADYMHLNSMYIDSKDANLICSFRNLDQIIKLKRYTNDIIWRLGGKNSDFALNNYQMFLRQHFARLTDNGQTLMMVDNGDAATRPYSRIIEFQLNEASKTINSFKSYNVPKGLFIQFMGSVQKSRGSYFIGCGSVPKVMEVNYNTGTISLEKDLPNASYRALKY